MSGYTTKSLAVLVASRTTLANPLSSLVVYLVAVAACVSWPGFQSWW